MDIGNLLNWIFKEKSAEEKILSSCTSLSKYHLSRIQDGLNGYWPENREGTLDLDGR